MIPCRVRIAAVLLVTLAHGASLMAQERAVFVARVGADTVAVEVMTRTGRTADATLQLRTPPGRVQQLVQLSGDQLVERITTIVRQGAAGETVAMRAELTFAGDSVRSHAEGAAGAASIPDRTMAIPAGAVPFLNLSGLSLELVLRRARAMGGDTARVPLLITGAPSPYVATVTRLGADSVVVLVAGTTLRAATDSVGRLLGASVAAQRLRIDRLPGDSPLAAWTGTRAAAASYAAPPGAPYTAENVVVATPAGTLAGTLTLPRASSGRRVPAVVLLSGSGPQDRDGAAPTIDDWRPFRELADTLSRRGIAVLRLDDRGIGSSSPAAAGGTMVDEAADVRTVVAWLRARPEIDPARIGLVGHSSGGAVAPMVAADDRDIRALVMIAAPATVGRTISHYQIRSIFAQDTTLPAAKRDSLLGIALRQADSALTAGPAWLRHFASYDPLATARRVCTPTLLLHGETDRQVPVAHARTLSVAMRAAGNRRVTQRTFPRTNHLLVDDPSGNALEYGTLPSLRVVPALRGALADWLARALQAP